MLVVVLEHIPSIGVNMISSTCKVIQHGVLERHSGICLCCICLRYHSRIAIRSCCISDDSMLCFMFSLVGCVDVVRSLKAGRVMKIQHLIQVFARLYRSVAGLPIEGVCIPSVMRCKGL